MPGHLSSFIPIKQAEETGASSPLAVTLLRIQHALEKAGVGFIENGDGPGVRLRKAL
jgi:hypothetical protein